LWDKARRYEKSLYLILQDFISAAAAAAAAAMTIIM